MSDITDRISEVLEAHSLWRSQEKLEYLCGSHEHWPVTDASGCDWAGCWQDHPAHVAEQIAEAFGFTEQWTWSPRSGVYGYAVDSREDAEYECDGNPYDIVHCWASKWEKP